MKNYTFLTTLCIILSPSGSIILRIYTPFGTLPHSMLMPLRLATTSPLSEYSVASACIFQ